MSDRAKKIFLAICIITPFLLYSVYYYSVMVKNAPYRFSDFESITYKYGMGDSLINQYNSKTGSYQYVNASDSLIKTHVKLNKDELLYLHRKAAENGFWNFPEIIENSSAEVEKINSPHYYIEFKYKNKSKHVLYDAAYSDKPKLGEAAKQLSKEISTMINDAQDRQSRVE